jgi:hypothetical protein
VYKLDEETMRALAPLMRAIAGACLKDIVRDILRYS